MLRSQRTWLVFSMAVGMVAASDPAEWIFLLRLRLRLREAASIEERKQQILHFVQDETRLGVVTALVGSDAARPQTHPCQGTRVGHPQKKMQKAHRQECLCHRGRRQRQIAGWTKCEGALQWSFFGRAGVIRVSSQLGRFCLFSAR